MAPLQISSQVVNQSNPLHAEKQSSSSLSRLARLVASISTGHLHFLRSASERLHRETLSRLTCTLIAALLICPTAQDGHAFKLSRGDEYQDQNTGASYVRAQNTYAGMVYRPRATTTLVIANQACCVAGKRSRLEAAPSRGCKYTTRSSENHIQGKGAGERPAATSSR